MNQLKSQLDLSKVDTGKFFKNFQVLRSQATNSPHEFNKVVQQILPLSFNRDQFAINDIGRLLEQTQTGVDRIKEMKPFVIKSEVAMNSNSIIPNVAVNLLAQAQPVTISPSVKETEQNVIQLVATALKQAIKVERLQVIQFKSTFQDRKTIVQLYQEYLQECSLMSDTNIAATGPQ